MMVPIENVEEEDEMLEQQEQEEADESPDVHENVRSSIMFLGFISGVGS